MEPITKYVYQDGEYSLKYSDGVIKYFDINGEFLGDNEKTINKKLLLV